MKNEAELYQCLECGLHYRHESIARECQTFCSTHHACNTEIAKHAVENEAKT